MSEYPISYGSIPKDSDDEYIYMPEVSSETRARLRRIIKIFVTLSDQEQELVTQEIEIDCR